MEKRSILKALIAFTLVSVSIFHYTTPIQFHSLHELYKLLYFVPIVLAAYLNGLKGGLITALAVTALYLPHVVFQWGGSFVANISRFSMIILYITLGTLTGYLWEQERKQRDYYQETSEKLSVSLIKLKETMDELQRIELQLRAAERLAILGELTASLAHEVRNPLTSIRGVTEILAEDPAGKKHQEFIDILLKEVQRLDHVVANYLSLARPNSAPKSPVNLNAVFESTLTLLGPEIRKKSLAVSVDLDHSLQLNCREDQFRQALLNVLLNAIQASAEKGEIKIKAKLNAENICIKISDSGLGFSEQAFEKMFSPFFSEKEGGTGLGLAITKRIVEAHDGRIYATNIAPHGAVVSMEFPR